MKKCILLVLILFSLNSAVFAYCDVGMDIRSYSICQQQENYKRQMMEMQQQQLKMQREMQEQQEQMMRQQRQFQSQMLQQNNNSYRW